VIVETGQLLGAGPAVELSDAGGAGAEGGASEAPLLNELGRTLVAAPLDAAPAAEVRFFFFTIARFEQDLKSGGSGGAAVVSKKDGRRKKNARRKQGKGEN
jgi:hypothetical protein